MSIIRGATPPPPRPSRGIRQKDPTSGPVDQWIRQCPQTPFNFRACSIGYLIQKKTVRGKGRFLFIIRQFFSSAIFSFDRFVPNTEFDSNLNFLIFIRLYFQNNWKKKAETNNVQGCLVWIWFYNLFIYYCLFTFYVEHWIFIFTIADKKY